MQLTEEEIQIEKQIHSTTDHFIQNLERDIKHIEERRKLTLWIIGVSTALEIFIATKFSWSKLNCFGGTLYVISGVLFLWNTIMSVRVYQMAINLLSIHLDQQSKFNYQRILMINDLGRNNSFTQQLIEHFKSGELVLKMKDLFYLKTKNILSEPIPRLAKWLIEISDENPAYVFIFQAMVTVVLLFTS
ncbi:MAG: hypothetical protein V4604_08160 [Bacteroidota bacterium]